MWEEIWESPGRERRKVGVLIRRKQKFKSEENWKEIWSEKSWRNQIFRVSNKNRFSHPFSWNPLPNSIFSSIFFSTHAFEQLLKKACKETKKFWPNLEIVKTCSISHLTQDYSTQFRKAVRLISAVIDVAGLIFRLESPASQVFAEHFTRLVSTIYTYSSSVG